MANEKNLFKLNSLPRLDDFGRDKLQQSLAIDVKDYMNFVEESIKVVQRLSLKVPVKLAEDQGQTASEEHIKYAIDLDALNDRDAERVERELFEQEPSEVSLDHPTKANARTAKIKERDAEEKWILLETSNRGLSEVYVRANDYQLRMQRNALKNLRDRPLKHYEALQRLFQRTSYALSYFNDTVDDAEQRLEWKVLTDTSKDGTEQQREFVRKALATEDFCLLEGPPGSGKTTAIVELIVQLAQQGKRVLLVSATHVAVDNVIHRILTTYKDVCEQHVMPMRIGSKDNVRKDSVLPYLMQDLTARTRKELVNRLMAMPSSESRAMMLDSLKGKEGKAYFEKLIHDSVNLVGATMIGVLQHPKIKNATSDSAFDVMIVDESSKVTFLDFLVPALHAKKWILVGDDKQLSPYVEDDMVAQSIKSLLVAPQREILRESFELLSRRAQWSKDGVAVVFSHDPDGMEEHLRLAEPSWSLLRLPMKPEPSLEAVLEMNGADVVIAAEAHAEAHMKFIGRYLRVKAYFFESENPLPAELSLFQAARHRVAKKDKSYVAQYIFDNQGQDWEEMVASRLSQRFQYRMQPENTIRLEKELSLLLQDHSQDNTTPLAERVEAIHRVAFPSIMELLHIGIGRKTDQNGKEVQKLLYDGLMGNEGIRSQKFESLSYQHRMHDQIAQTSREQFYQNQNLLTANTIVLRADLLGGYKPGEDRVVWQANADETFRKAQGRKGRPENINPTEVDDIRAELADFADFASSNPDKTFEVAVLTFYREQEGQLRKMLRKWTGQGGKSKNFSKGKIQITLCTVDKFQGDEADLVLLSFAKHTKKAFYNSPNRLNVAITRARHKLVLFGNRRWLSERASSPAVRQLAENFKSRLNSRSKN